MEKFDFIIIGAGSAGCVLANRIVKTGKFKILLNVIYTHNAQLSLVSPIFF